MVQVDFRGDAEGARRIINNWVQNRTETTIKEAVPPGAMSSATLLALVSTTYFKVNWSRTKQGHHTQYSLNHIKILQLPSHHFF